MYLGRLGTKGCCCYLWVTRSFSLGLEGGGVERLADCRDVG